MRSCFFILHRSTADVMKINNRFLLLVAFCPIFYLPYAGLAQVKKGDKQPAAKDQTRECIQVLYDFAKAYSEITVHQDKNKVLAFFTPSLATEITTVNIKNNVQNRYSDYRQFAEYLEGLANNPLLRIRYTIDKILYAVVKDKFGLVVYETSYEISREGDVLITGREINTANMLKTDNRWLINYYTIYDIAAGMQRGTCQCEILKGEEGKYITRTIYPSGERYGVSMDNFTITYSERFGGRLVRVRDLYFAWKKTGNVVALSVNNDQLEEVGNELGITDDEQEVLLLILRNFLFADNCLSVRKR